ncbi:hypothetical protein CLV71_108108 [Actinophytocola oryzae]|uniref:Uncharacterized protein n=1 Tax=Actinophytocola oryzae TaxID=502181 RepID=A0A4R7VI35_9PSEU|nr:hypothetical protein CLV71_108108 [Actinophytocola oryzae]
MNASAELVRGVLAALDRIPGLRPATLPRPARTPAAWNWDSLAVDVAEEPGGDRVVVVRVVATALPLPPIVRQAEEELLAVLAASALPVTRLRLEITGVDGTALDELPGKFAIEP